jgi:hypothetical protein
MKQSYTYANGKSCLEFKFRKYYLARLTSDRINVRSVPRNFSYVERHQLSTIGLLPLLKVLVLTDAGIIHLCLAKGMVIEIALSINKAYDNYEWFKESISCS